MKITKDEYIENFRMPEDSCKLCSDVIWYPHTLIINKENTAHFINANFLTTKKISNSEYRLCICYSCLLKKYPEIATRNSSKLFNTCNKYMKFAFDVSDLDFFQQRKNHGITLDKMISKYGEEEGLKKWNSYCKTQSLTNTFEYKKEKLGWSKEDFEKFNKSRAITRENLTLKYGEALGDQKWEKYLELQKYTKSLNYLIDKHGKEKGTSIYLTINKSKGLTLDNYISKYGLSEGLEIFKERVLKKDSFFSKVSQSFFEELDFEIKDLGLSTYYQTKNGEFGKILKTFKKYCKLDFFIKELNLAIEYYGDYWHANPQIYPPESIMFSSKLAKTIWDEDRKRTEALFLEHGIETLIVWQKDDFKNRIFEIKKIANEIRRKI